MTRPARNAPKGLRRIAQAVETKTFRTELCDKPGTRVLDPGRREATGSSHGQI